MFSFYFIALFTVTLLWICISGFSNPIQIIYIDTENPSNVRVNENYLSITLDAIIIAEKFKGYNLTDPKLIQMVQYLSPAYIRIGGNLADRLRFSPDDKVIDTEVTRFYGNNSNSTYSVLLLTPNFTMTGSQWLELINFVKLASLVPIFDLNALIRFENGSWDYRNAYELLRFSHEHGIICHWELGNEPNSFQHKFGEIVNASQLSKDFILLRQILNGFPLYKSSLLLGPDITRPQNNHTGSELYLREFLKYGGNISAVSWHQYYLNGHIATAKDFLDLKTFDCLKGQIDIIKMIVHSSPVSKIPIWLGETSSAYGGGAPNLSDTFIGSFLWIDKLGLAAKMGISIVMRQSIFYGYYGLLDTNFDPNPDWWVSILYKSLVGTKLVSYYTATTSKVRLYVHCTKKTSVVEGIPSFTIYGINLDISVAQLRIEGILPLKISELQLAYTYELTYDKKITSKGIQLNGKLLKMLLNNTLPKMMPKIQYTNSLTMPPLSIVFWVIPTSEVKMCSLN